MSKHRYINTKFWDDSYIINLDPIEKLMFLYFLTNPLTNIIGCYEISLKRIAFDTGIDKEMVLKILDRFKRDDKVLYSDGWIAIKNFIRNQKQSDNPKDKINICINKEINEIPQNLRKFIDTPSSPLKGCINLGININKNISINKDINKDKSINRDAIKKHYLDYNFVLLSENEYNKLINQYGEEFTHKCIEKLNNYKGANGKKYKSDYLAILNWVITQCIKDGIPHKSQLSQESQIAKSQKFIDEHCHDTTLVIAGKRGDKMEVLNAKSK